MAGHGGLEPSAERGPVNHRDYGLGISLHAIQNAEEARPLAPIAAGCDLAEFLDVRAGDEGTASTDQHDGLHGIVFFKLFQACDNSFRNARAQRVHRRIVHRENANFAVFTRLDQTWVYLIAHPYDSIAPTICSPPRTGLVFRRSVVARSRQEDIEEHAERITDEKSGCAKSNQRYWRGKPELITHR